MLYLSEVFHISYCFTIILSQMKFKFLCLLCASGWLATACVDNDYDFGKLETDNIAIGDASSVTEMPLATVYVSMSEIANNQSDILALCRKADNWLPAPLPGNADYIDLTQINDPDYSGAIFDALIDQMDSDPEKLDAVTALVYEEYAPEFSELLGVPVTEPELFEEAFRIGYKEPAVNEELRNCFIGFLSADLHVEPFSYDIGSINISNDVVDMLADNLDPEGTPNPTNTLSLAGEIVSRLPITLQLSPSFRSGSYEIVSFDAHIDALSDICPIEESEQTRIYAEGLRQLVNGAEISIPVVFEKYYPGDSGFLNTPADDQTPQIEIRLHLIKRGGIKINF